MTNNNNSATWAVVILIGLMLLLAFRSLFFVLPFGFFPGVANVFRGAGHAFDGWWGRFIPFGLFPLALLALWIYVIVWVYRDAEKRGMNGLLWALLVLIGNLIGLIIYLIIRNEAAVRSAAPPAAKCPGCGNSLGPGYAYCPHCGRPVKAACPACKKPVQADWKVCPSCGAGLDPGRTEQG